MTSKKEMEIGRKLRRKKSNFTLLEVMVGLTLLLLASGLVGWKMYGAVQKKRVQSELERLKVRFAVSQKLAMTMQADWKGVIKKAGKEWLFEVSCEESRLRQFAPLHLTSGEVLFNGKRVEELTFDFFSSGKVQPEGTFLIQYGEEQVKWKTAELFERKEGKEAGPVHPLEVINPP